LTASSTKDAPTKSDQVDNPDVDGGSGEEANESRNEDQGDDGVGEVVVILDSKKEGSGRGVRPTCQVDV